jgi:hypothetical protein
VDWQSHMYHVCKSSKCVIILAFGRHAISLANLVQVRASSTGKKQALLVECFGEQRPRLSARHCWRMRRGP